MKACSRTQSAPLMDQWNESMSHAGFSQIDSHARLVNGQQVAVTAGEGLGWMAHVVALERRLPECAYRVELADGRSLVKRESELEPLSGDCR